jgi:hypothetical protein
MTTLILTEFDAETRFKVRASRGAGQEALAGGLAVSLGRHASRAHSSEPLMPPHLTIECFS